MKKTCLKCGNAIPATIKVDGKRRNLKSRKFCLSCTPFGTHNTRNIANAIKLREYATSSFCAGCKKELPIELFYACSSRKIQSNCKICTKIRIRERCRKFKLLCVEYKGGKCICCGYSKSICALDFHHRNKEEKDFLLSTVKSIILSDVIKGELNKCDLVCSNCHREIHEKEMDD
jgi:hypothetical protein